jgi:hypothetical protein
VLDRVDHQFLCNGEKNRADEECVVDCAVDRQLDRSGCGERGDHGLERRLESELTRRGGVKRRDDCTGFRNGPLQMTCNGTPGFAVLLGASC